MTRTLQHRAAIYARVSTLDQEPENQGSRDRRPALDAVLTGVKRRQFDVLVCWRLDRLGRSLKHLVTLLDELQALGVAFVSLQEGIDATTPAGKQQMHILAAIAEFERARIAERVRAGLARAKANGRRLGPRPVHIPIEDLERTAHLSIRRAAAELGISRSVLHRALHTCHPMHSAFQCSTAAKIQPHPSSSVNTRTPSVPHITLGAWVMTLPSWVFAAP